jgi:hypothetical protein
VDWTLPRRITGKLGDRELLRDRAPYLENWVYQQVYIVNVRGEPYLVHPSTSIQRKRHMPFYT